MWRIACLLALLLCATPLCAQVSTFPPGVFLSRGALDPAAGGGTFTGPGDIVSGAKGWWGLRAYSTADRGNKLVNVCNVSDVTCVDMVSDATTGNLVVTTVGGSDCSLVTCTIKTFYDRSGALFGNGAVAWDQTQGTIANRAQFKLSAIGSKPCALFNNNGNYQTAVGSISTIPQPWTFSAVANRTGNISTSGGILNFGGASAWLAFADGSANTLQANAGGSSIAPTATDGVFHAIQFVGNAASSNVYVDGSSNTGNPGSGGLGSNVSMQIAKQPFGPLLTGYYCEGGVWPSAFNGTQLSNMNGNQHSYWGF